MYSVLDQLTVEVGEGDVGTAAKHVSIEYSDGSSIGTAWHMCTGKTLFKDHIIVHTQ